MWIFNGIRKIILGIVTMLIVGIVLFILLYSSVFRAPADFPVPYNFTITAGQSLTSISNQLYADHAIRSIYIFKVAMIVAGNDKNISEGEYYFDTPLNVLSMAFRISGKEFGINRTKVTFPEGFTNQEMADRLAATFPGFDTALFMQLAKNQEGYLFPDTYGFFPDVPADLAITTLHRNYEKKIAGYQTDILASGHTEQQIITMASIIEKEANGNGDRAVISGILWKRIETGIALQVDAPFLYVLQTQHKDLTHKDLSMVSPYNTYTHKGLPPTPIGNPGIAAIEAAIHPERSPYLYYLHDATGTIHYASTYKEHEKNIQLYLK